MLISSIIIIVSLAMFVYWFRYSCVLILESSWSEDLVQAVALQNDLSFGSVSESLAQTASLQSMDRVRDLLDRDLERVLSMRAKISGGQEAGRSLECFILRQDYRMMKAWYAVTRSLAGSKAKCALREMALVVGYMAGECGDQLAAARN